MKLSVHQLSADEVYQDYARIASEYRKDLNGKRLPAGIVYSLRCVDTGKRVFVILRNTNVNEASVAIDYRTRKKLGIHRNHTYEFALKPAGFGGQIRWAITASDIRYSLPVRLTLILGGLSLALGIISVVLSILPVCRRH
ncbi:MAG TPA: hypothetical protein VII95_02310 [Terriglobales bacterium]|jgi:hypothetical protein